MTATGPLATAADLAELGYAGLTDGMITRASVRIRGFTRQDISRVVDDVVTLPANDPLKLPQRPVVAVSLVEQLFRDDTAVTLPAISYELRNNRLYGIGCRDYWPYLGLPVWVRITYTHGDDPVRPEILDILGQVATRLTAESSADMAGGVAGAKSEAIDDYRIEYDPDLRDSGADLLDGEKAALNRILGASMFGSVPL